MDQVIFKKQLRQFGIIIGIFFPLIFGLIMPLLFGHSYRIWTLFISFPILIMGILKPYYLSSFYKLGINVGNYLGWINSHLILGLVFIIVLQPIAFFMKIFGYDPLRKKIDKNIKSYRERKVNNIDLKKIF